MSNFLGETDSESDSDYEFPTAQVVKHQGQMSVDEEISKITDRLEFLAGMVPSPARDTPTVAFQNKKSRERPEYRGRGHVQDMTSQREARDTSRDSATVRPPRVLRENVNLGNISQPQQRVKDSGVSRQDIPTSCEYRGVGPRGPSLSPKPMKRRLKLEEFPARKDFQWDDMHTGVNPRHITMRKVPTFSGRDYESWNDWLLSFERVARNAGLSDDRILAMRFSECISGTALSFYNRMTPQDQDSWQSTKYQFSARFGLEGYATQGRLQLANLSIKEGESATAYKQRFVEAWEKVYPHHGGRTNMRDDLMVDKFLETIQDREACMFIGQQNPITVDQACQALGSWLMGRARVTQQNICVGFRTNSNKDVQKGQSEVANSNDALKQELANLKDKLERVMQSSRDRSGGRRNKSGNGNNQNKDNGQRRWKSPPSHIRERYVIPANMKREGCWFCGNTAKPFHSIRDCPTRLRQEALTPGSTVRAQHAKVAQQQVNC